MKTQTETSEPQQIELTDRQKLSIINYRRYGGIDIEIIGNNKVRISQNRLINGIVLRQKDLLERARKIFPDKEIKIIPVVYNLQLSDITEEWIFAKMDEYGIKRNDLIKQMAIDKSYLSLLFSDKSNKWKINLTRSMKTAFFYFFLSCELSRDLLAQTQEIVQKQMQEYKTS